MIEDDSTSVIVKYAPPWLESKHPSVHALLENMSSFPKRESLRALQPYTVNLLNHEFKKAQQKGLVREVIPGVWEWQGKYDWGSDGKHGQGIVLDSIASAESHMW